VPVLRPLVIPQLWQPYVALLGSCRVYVAVATTLQVAIDMILHPVRKAVGSLCFGHGWSPQGLLRRAAASTASHHLPTSFCAWRKHRLIDAERHWRAVRHDLIFAIPPPSAPRYLRDPAPFTSDGSNAVYTVESRLFCRSGLFLVSSRAEEWL